MADNQIDGAVALLGHKVRLAMAARPLQGAVSVCRASFHD